MRGTASLATFLSLSLLSNGYQWPSDPVFEALEEMYTLSDGLGSSGFIGGVEPCSFSPANNRTSGRQAAAEWVRTAYHDMATADVAAGTGGLDASISFETDRAENVGDAFNASFGFFVGFQNSRVSMSDLIALGAVYAVRACSGPMIPFRAGRIDATEAGPKGVPEPQQDLASHTASFAKQGFNVSEMIGLVACGHTLGGVHEEDFPTIVYGETNSDNNTSGMEHFDDSFDEFDNRVAVQWVNSSLSTNPLATGFNSTTNSDGRIFAADGNATMRDLASSNTVFQSRCAELLARMIDTVPKGVQLTDVITPIPVKPYGVQLSIDDKGQLHLEGYVRLFTSNKSASPSDYEVNVTWTDHNGAACEGCSTTTRAQGFPGTIFSGTVMMFNFDTTIDPKVGFSAFSVEYTSTPGGPVTKADNGGAGFPFSDVVMLQPSASCTSDGMIKAVAAVRNDQPITAVYIDYTSAETQPGTVMLKMVPSSINMTASSNSSASSLYTLYNAEFKVDNAGSSSFNIFAEAGGKVYTDDFKRPNGLNSC